MNSKSSTKWQRNLKFIIPGIGVIILVVSISLTPKIDRSYINLSALVGSIASITALAMGIDQLRQLKETSEITESTVKQTIIKLKETLTIIDITKAIGIIENGISLVRHGDNLELVYYKLKDLYPCLLSLKQLENSKIIDIIRTSESITTLKGEIDNLNAKMIDDSLPLDVSILVTNLEGIVSYLSEVETDLKFKRDEN